MALVFTPMAKSVYQWNALTKIFSISHDASKQISASILNFDMLVCFMIELVEPFHPATLYEA